MDMIVGLISLFWDPAFEFKIFPFFTAMALWRGRSVEVVFLFFLLHSMFCGGIDLFHLVLFSFFSLCWILDRMMPHVASYSMFSSIQVLAYWIFFGWFQGLIAIMAGVLGLFGRSRGEG